MIYFTSDTHFGHQRIIDLCNRPFSTVDEMNEALIDNWNSVVNPADTVYHLGDFVMGPFVETMKLVDRLNGLIYLVPGNHDRVSRAYPHRTGEHFWRDFDIYNEYEIEIIGERVYGFRLMNIPVPVNMSHYPYVGDSHNEDRFKELRPVDDGNWLLHGHVHNEWQVRDRMINVGVDVWNYTPISIDTIYDIIK